MLLRESHDEVHRNLLKGEGAFFGGDAVEQCFPFVGHNFVLLADRTAFYVVCDPLPHPCPWQDFCSSSNRFISSGVSCGGMIMDEGHEVSFRGVWYLHSSGVYEEFWFEEGLIFIVVVSLIRVWWV